MEPPHGCSPEATGLLSPTVDEDREEPHDATPEEISLTVECRPEQEGAAAQEEDEKNEGEGHDGAGSLSHIDDESHEGGGASGGDHVPPQAALGFAQPRERQLQSRRTRFTVPQWQELESFFRHNQYPDMPARNELARRMHVPEARVKSWFRNRRARWRRHQRTLMLRNMPPVIQAPPAFIILRAPYYAPLVRNPYWRQGFVQLPPPLLGLPLLPVQPMPHIFLPFVPFPPPCLYPAGPGSPGLVWCLIIINPILYLIS